MSLSSRKSPLAIRERVQFDNLESALLEWGYEWKSGQLVDVECSNDSLSESEIASIESGKFSEQDMKSLLAHKSKGAKYLGWEIWRAVTFNRPYSIEKILSDWAALKEIRHWMSQQPLEDLKKMALVEILSENSENIDGEPIERIRFQPQKLLGVGVRFAWQAERFCELYKELCVEGRPWGSCYQPGHTAVLKIATTVNYNRLPLWVKKVVVNSSNPVQIERVGNIWRLINCAKAWKHAPALPKGIAEKVGRMSVRSRLLANFAWREVNRLNEYKTWDEVVVPRSEIVQRFWLEFRRLSNLPILELLKEKFEDIYDKKDFNTLRTWAEQTLNLPFGFLLEIWGSYKNSIFNDIAEKMADFLSPAEVCQRYFGTRGKATQKAFSACAGKNQWKWASALAFGNPDLAQKYLSLPQCVEFEPDAVELLKTIGDGPTLRMVSTTTFKVRGEVKPVEKFHVKDSGYLWSHIKNKPELGRVRCWLSLHEDLARQFVKEQPNESLKIHPDWQPLNGMCAVDGSWEIEIPHNTSTLKYWGEKLHHCVGGYGPKINSGGCIILGVKIDGIITYTVEMCPDSWSKGKQWSCNQFYGVRNSSAPRELKRSVLEALNQAVNILI